jgi:hypothetical protein
MAGLRRDCRLRAIAKLAGRVGAGWKAAGSLRPPTVTDRRQCAQVTKVITLLPSPKSRT